MKLSGIKALAILTALTCSASLASAQATRTWVSGVGDDANPCSRTAPCKTFAGAISKTAPGGEINVLDPGGFGAVTITKSISIVNDGVGSAGVVVSGTNAIIVNAAATDVVVLRGLDIEGLGTGLNGIRHLSGGSLSVENCTINNFTQKAIDFEPSGASQLAVKNTIIRNNVIGAASGGIFIKPGAVTFALASIDGVTVTRNTFGIRAENNARVTIRNSVVSGSSQDGIVAFFASGVGPVVTVAASATVNNGAGGLRSEGSGAVIQADGVTITGNATGLVSVASGAIVSLRSNLLGRNTTDGAFTSTVPLQ
jgi:hypothetical protein